MKSKYKIVFFGNSKYSVIVAKTLHTEYGLSSVVTIPDRPLGRKKILTPSPVKQFAISNNIPALTFDKLDKETIASLRHPGERSDSRIRSRFWTSQNDDKQPDFLVVADYGLILPKELLALPKFAPLNVHHSLLPKYRGPSPAPTAILSGDKISGVTIIKMTDTVDAGPIMAQQEYTLKSVETTDSLLTMLNTLGGKLVVDVIFRYPQITPISQNEREATNTERLTKQDGCIDLNNPPSPTQLDRMIRAYYPWPGVWTAVQIATTNNQQPTTNKRIIKFLPGQKLQVEGGKPMSVKDFINGYPEMKEKIQQLVVSS